MSKKPSFSSLKKNRLEEAKKELKQEKIKANKNETKQTTVILEADLLYAAKEVALERKKSGIEPNTITGMIRQALLEIVNTELKK